MLLSSEAGGNQIDLGEGSRHALVEERKQSPEAQAGHVEQGLARAKQLAARELGELLL